MQELLYTLNWHQLCVCILHYLNKWISLQFINHILVQSNYMYNKNYTSVARILISSITRKYNSSASYADCGQGIKKSSLKRVPYASNSAEQKGTCAPYNDSAHSSKSKSTKHLKSWVPASEEIKTTLQPAKIIRQCDVYIIISTCLFW